MRSDLQGYFQHNAFALPVTCAVFLLWNADLLRSPQSIRKACYGILAGNAVYYVVRLLTCDIIHKI